MNLKPATGASAPMPTDMPATTTPGRRVLIVDDNVDAAESLAMILNLGGHQTHCAYAPETALESVAALKPDVVVLDIGLPRMDGYEVARRIRADKCPVRLIALSGYGRTENAERARAAGFNAYLVKPVDFDELERVLQTLR
jgi:CheY-like chemotaxis protein